MIIDVTGVELTPGNFGKNCLGNGKHFDKNGEPIECCCEECDYLLCCTSAQYYTDCVKCGVKKCPNYKGAKE